MKKKLLIFISTLSLLLIFLSAFYFLKDARKNRTWPFNSGLVLYFPQWVKYYAYKFTNPADKKLSTQFYKISLQYFTIPNTDSVGGGGSINLLKKNKILLTLNDGSNYIFNSKTSEFTSIKSNFKNKYSSIRDVYYDGKLSKIFLLGMEKINDDCKQIKFDSYEIKYLEKKYKFENRFNIWKSEKLCNNPMENNGGGRIAKFNNNFFISTGFFTQNINSGIVQFPQDKNSSFGKIIKINDINKHNNSSIFSIGHRNPQGLFVSEKFKLLLSTEHGPFGGDEINIINEANNYGWPCKSYGVKYSYDFKKNTKSWPDDLKKYGCNKNKIFTDPLFSWSPSIGASQGLEYKGEEFKKFQNNFFVSSLKGNSLFRLLMSEKQKIINFEKIFISERIRDLTETSDGKILLYTDGGSLILLSRI